jgi:hypothetical protein
VAAVLDYNTELVEAVEVAVVAVVAVAVANCNYGK